LAVVLRDQKTLLVEEAYRPVDFLKLETAKFAALIAAHIDPSSRRDLLSLLEQMEYKLSIERLGHLTSPFGASEGPPEDDCLSALPQGLTNGTRDNR
jgi:hypothetical protein